MVAKYGVLLLLLKSLMLIFSNKICSKILILWKNSIFAFVSKFWEFIPNHPIIPVEQNRGECILRIIFIAMLLNIGTVCSINEDCLVEEALYLNFKIASKGKVTWISSVKYI